MTLVKPGGIVETASVSYTTQWQAADPDSVAEVTLYASPNPSIAANGIPIATGLVEGVVTQFTWNVTTVPTGMYYIVAGIDDGTGPTRWDESAVAVFVTD